MPKLKKLLIAVIAGVITAVPLPVFAEGSPVAAITVKMSYKEENGDHTPLTDGTLSIYKYKNEDGSVTEKFKAIVLNEDAEIQAFSDTGDATEDVLTQAQTLADFVKDNSIPSDDDKDVQEGEVKFALNEGGTYLIVQSCQSKGYLPITPVLVSLPASDSNYEGYYAMVKPKIERIIYHSATITKKVTGNMGSRAEAFNITLSAPSLADTSVENKDGTSYRFDENGNLRFTLKDGQSFVLDSVPEGTVYSVKEDDYSSEGYATSYENQDVTLLKDTTTTVTNDRKVALSTGHRETMTIGIAGCILLAGAGYILLKEKIKKK